MKVYLESSPLHNDHAVRGIGAYTKFLFNELFKLQNSDFQLVDSIAKADIVHFPFFDLFSPTLPLWKGSKKRIVTIHDVIPLLFPEGYAVGIKGKINFIHQKIALKNVQKIITDSQASKRDISRFLQVPLSKLEVVYLASNPQIQPTNLLRQQEVRKKFSLPEHFALYVGDINYNKNIPELIKATAYFQPGLELVCVGKNFYSHSIPEWQAIEQALSSTQRKIIFVTDVNKGADDELASLYSAADVYVQPSLAEGFGLPVLEAMQAKTLVVSTMNSSLIEVGDTVVEYVHENAKAIAEGVQKILNLSPIEKKKRIENAWKWAQTFSWQKTAQETLRIYATVHTSS